MKRLIILGAVWTIAVARPELYKEKEDFQFSRSSSDDGTKSGFYGAQRGNMGGNYERAHNMDSLAQNQMSGLVRQVEGELGDGAKTRTGSVYTAANSRGTYGSGHFDLSNLGGRNFQEGTTFDDSQSRSSLSSSSAYNAHRAGYANSQLQSSIHSGYQTAGHSGLNLQSGDLQSQDDLQGTSQYDYGRHSSHSAGYNAQSGFHQQSAYDSSNTNAHSGGYGSNVQTRLISATPVRVFVRPGTRVAIPLAAQSYDITHGSSLIDQNSLASDAEVLGSESQRTLYRPSNAKHYESSYNYRKEWEKHDTIPSTVFTPTTPTENPFPKNSELYEDRASEQYDARRADSQRVHSSIYGGYANAHVKSASSQTRTNYDTQHGALLHTNAYTGSGYNTGSDLQGASLDSSSNSYIQAQHNAGSRYHGGTAGSNSLTQAAYNKGFNTDLNSQVEDLNSKPKSYQSSYSYHKSWERQGDPYVIKPASSGYIDGQSAQRLTSSTKNQAFAATGSHYGHTHQSETDCDENGHIRVARSYNANQYEEQQQKQNIEDLGQQVEDLGQQAEDLGQQVEDSGQQTQSHWGQLGQQAQTTWENLEDLSQQAHTKWDEAQNNWDKFEDLRHKTEDNWEQKLKDTTQLENLDQNTQNDLSQQKQQSIGEWGSPHDIAQQDQWDLSKLIQHDEENVDRKNQNNNYEKLQPTNDNKKDHISIWEKVDNFGYQSATQKVQNELDNGHTINNKSMETQTHNSGSYTISQSVDNNSEIQPHWDQSTVDTQETDKIPDTNEQNNTTNLNFNYYDNENQSSKHEISLQETHSLNENYNWNKYSSSHRQEQTTSTHSSSNSNTFETIPSNTAPLLSFWDKLGTIEQQLTLPMGNKNKEQENYYSQVYLNSQSSNQNARHDQTNQTAFIQKYNNNQTTPYHYVNENVNQNKSNGIRLDKERPQDLGRGDIGPEDVPDSVDDKEPARYPLIPNTANINTNITQQNLSASEQNEDLQKMSHSFEQGHLTQQEFLNFEQNQNVQQPFGQNKQDFGQQDYLVQQNVQNVGLDNLHDIKQDQNVEQQTLQDFVQHETLSQQDLQVSQQDLQVSEQSESQAQHNLFDFGQQNMNAFGQHNMHDFEQQNVHHYGQQNVHDFGQQNMDDFGQQNIHDFGQQNVHDFGQQNMHDFGQQNMHDFGQQNNFEQQNLQNFEQQNLQEIRQSKPDQQVFAQGQDQMQQTQQDFVNSQDLKQQTLPNFQENENLEQQNIKEFEHDDNLEQMKSQDDGQHNIHDFGQQNTQSFEQHEFREKMSLPNSEEQHLHDFRNTDQQNLHTINNFNTYEPEQQRTYQEINSQSQNPLHPKEIEEPIQIQKQNNDIQLNSPLSSNIAVLPIEPVTEKPGFWKSVGNKFSRAKSKISSWFQN